jgi:hypothetical protein
MLCLACLSSSFCAVVPMMRPEKVRETKNVVFVFRVALNKQVSLKALCDKRCDTGSTISNHCVGLFCPMQLMLLFCQFFFFIRSHLSFPSSELQFVSDQTLLASWCRRRFCLQRFCIF